MTDPELSGIAARALAAAGAGAQARVLHERRVRAGELRDRLVVELAVARDGRVGLVRTTDVSEAGLAAAAAAAATACAGDRHGGFPGWPEPAPGRAHAGWDPAVARLEPGSLPPRRGRGPRQSRRDRLLDRPRRVRAPHARGGRWVHDTRSAALAGAASTGHAGRPGGSPGGPWPRNLVLVGGGAGSEAELLDPVEAGVHVSALHGLRTIGGDAVSAVVEGRLVGGGELGPPLAPLRFTGSPLDVLATVEAMTMRQRLAPSGTVCPALRVGALRLAPV